MGWTCQERPLLLEQVAHTTSHDKGRFTVVFVAMADGRKLKPFVVLKGVRPVTELMRVPGVEVAFSRNGQTNKVLTKDWVDRVWGSLNFGRRLLVWDAYKCQSWIASRATYTTTQTATSASSLVA